MDSSAPAAAPWVVLVLALLGLSCLAAVALTGRRGRAARPPAASPTPVPTAPPRPATRWADDDLPGFLDAPPGTPVPSTDSTPPAAPTPQADDGRADDGHAGDAAAPDGSGRVVAGMAAAALALVALLAGVAAVGLDGATEPTHPASARPVPGTAIPAAPTGPTRTTIPRPPPLPGVPADPLPGESGAGALANRSVPLGEDGVTARLAFGGIVVERHAVGTTVAYPSVSVSATGNGSAALAHVRLPAWNCMTSEPPADPGAAGCVRSTTKYADLPSPALTVTGDGRDVRLTGRFPTYTRPVGTGPTYTGRVYDLTVTVSPAGPVREAGRTPRGRCSWAPTGRRASTSRRSTPSGTPADKRTVLVPPGTTERTAAREPCSPPADHGKQILLSHSMRRPRRTLVSGRDRLRHGTTSGRPVRERAEYMVTTVSDGMARGGSRALPTACPYRRAASQSLQP